MRTRTNQNEDLKQAKIIGVGTGKFQLIEIVAPDITRNDHWEGSLSAAWERAKEKGLTVIEGSKLEEVSKVLVRDKESTSKKQKKSVKSKEKKQ